MKKFLFILFPVLLIASCVGSYQNDTPLATTENIKPIVEAVKSPAAPEIKVIDTAAAAKVDTTNSRVSEIKTTELKIETPLVETVTTSSLSNNNHYTNVDGEKVHSPAYAPSVPAGASAVCQDGTYSFSQHRSGTCSHHGGVAEWL